jgi:mannitol/fructose-specific phosphotransferase system IIA component (Ntr-type)
LLQRLRLPEGVDRELMLEMVLARQQRGSTLVGDGIAIPHARYPIVASLAEPLLALGFPAAPVDAGTAGGPVTALFLLLTPDSRTHLQLLARLSRALQSELRAPVLARGGDAAILAAAAVGDAAGNQGPARSRKS